MRWGRSFAILAVLLFAGPATADSDARGFVEGYIASTKRIRDDTALPPDRRLVQAQTLLHDAYDFVGAPQAILGRHWAKASPDQQRRTQETFEQYLIVAYGTRFDAMAATLAVTGSSPAGGRTVVHSTSTGSRGQPVRIDWVLVQPEGMQWRIADIVVDGVGSVELMRQEFGAVLRANNNDIEALLAALRQRVEAAKAAN
ncbi:MAG: ABC transporter substrate-binding protein [Magnetospirillum sp.]|nr:ABC transporter substrate-binding protein [Magnetospirillum sp.]